MSRQPLARRQPLTVGDGFRIGVGIGFWVIAATLALWAFLFAVIGIGSTLVR